MKTIEGVFDMPKQTLRIEVVRSTSKHISSMSERSARDIVATLQNYYTDVVLTNVDTVDALYALVARKPDLVFAGLYHLIDPATEAKIWLADELEKHGIRYTGSGKHANRLSLNKHLAKQRMIESGVNTAAFRFAPRGEEFILKDNELRYPLFVKPTNKSGGQGVDEFSVIREPQQLYGKINFIHDRHHADALVEEYLSGREFSVGVLGDPSAEIIAMPLELVAAKDSNGDRIRSKAVKTSDSEDMNEITNPAERREIGDFAIKAFRALGGTGYGRIDIRLNDEGVPYFLEANHIPSLIQADSSFLRAYELTTGGTYESMILKIVDLALERSAAIDRVDQVDELTLAS